MANSIDQAFITQFESEVFVAHQRKGSLIVPRFRQRTFGVGETIRFPKAGTIEATEKARFAQMSPSDLDHTYEEVSPTRNVTASWFEDFDLIRTNIDERGILAQAHAFGQGRKSDAKCIAALDAGAREYDSLTPTAIDNDLVIDFMTDFIERDVEQNDWTMIVGPKTYAALKKLDDFVNADLVPPEYVAMSHTQGMVPRMYQGFYVMVHTGVTKVNGDEMAYMFQRNSVGYGISGPMKTNIDWVATNRAYLMSSEIADNALVIDNTAVLRALIDVTS